MTTEGDKSARRSGGWRKVAKADGAGDAAEKALLRKAMAINPVLRSGRNTQEMMSDLQAAKRGASAAGDTPARLAAPATGPLPPPDRRHKTLAVLLAELEQWLDRESERVAQHRARALERRNALGGKAKSSDEAMRAEIVAALRSSDPSLRLPLTASVLRAHARFLGALGLDDKSLRAALEVQS